MGSNGDLNSAHRRLKNPSQVGLMERHELNGAGDGAKTAAPRDDLRLSRISLGSTRLVSKVRQMRDMLWQEEPDRILKYKAYHLHYYGWNPLLVPRNFKAMVLSDVYLQLQGLVLVGWMVALHTTGLGVPKSDLASFLRLFGTPYAGAIFNMSMLITFILGLFITLVVNRWWTIRMAYSKLMGTTLDLCMTIATVIKHPLNERDEQTLKARAELTRLLNLGHLLVVSQADAVDRDYKPSYGVRRYAKTTFGTLWTSCLGANLSSSAESDIFIEKPAKISFKELANEALINKEEWDIICEQESKGLPKFQTVYRWAQSLLHKCKGADWIMSAPQMLPIMLNKLNTIVESGAQIFSTISSQMPYPYVHLVSFTVHVYLFIITTWFGAFLHAGFPTEENFKFIPEDDDVAGARLHKSRGDVSSSYWTAVWCYVFVLLANVMFQGLLDMHSLLDNPFGAHCAKFPLRAQITNLLMATRTMLERADTMPPALQNVFCTSESGEADSKLKHGGDIPKSKGMQLGGKAVPRSGDYADFLNPPSKDGGPVGEEIRPTGKVMAANGDRRDVTTNETAEKAVVVEMASVDEQADDVDLGQQ